MAVPFLVRFVDQVLTDLESTNSIELAEGKRARVVLEVASALGTTASGGQLVASLSKALLANAGVEELYLDDMELKDRIGDLGNAWMRGG